MSLFVLFKVSLSFVESSAGCGVDSLVCFEELRKRLFCLGQLNVLQVWGHLLFGCIYLCVGRENRDVIYICDKFSTVWRV